MRATEFIISVRSHIDRDKVKWWQADIELEDEKGPQTVRSDFWIGRTPQQAAESALKWVENYSTETQEG